MKILVACEESQRVTIELRNLGHEAYSCDIEPQSGGHPEYHIQQDVTPLINGFCSFNTTDGKRHTIDKQWDMIIAHPPCTYLSAAGARHLYPKGVLNKERFEKGITAKKFFDYFYNANCDKICIENPTPLKVFGLPQCTQVIQPWEFGHPFQKRTCLWLKGLPKLEPTDIVPEENRESTKVAGNWFNKGGKERQKNRAKTFPGIAKAIATQFAGKAE